jgi:WXG100 family type VII secretion target
MPFDHIQVTVSDLQAASAQFDARATDLEQLLQLVKSQIESLQSTWQGQAASDFVALMGKWNNDVQGIHDVLNTVSLHIKQAASTYQETDTGIARGFQAG